MLRKKVLISGCGISYTQQAHCKTWGNILRLTGNEVIDTGGPAVSNHWILNRAINYLLQNSVDYVVIQLTNLDKLDVEVDDIREETLVKPDTIRNFVIDNVWPSSVSLEHPAKQMWFEHLFSPRLELQDIEVKLRLLKFYCDTNHIPLLILKGYDLPENNFDELLYNCQSLYEQYISHDFYVYHNDQPHMSTPCLEFQFVIAYQIIDALKLDVKPQIDKIQSQYWSKNH